MAGQFRRAQWKTAALAAWLTVLAAMSVPGRAADTVSAADIPSVTTALVAAGFTAAIRRDDDGVAYILADEGGDEFDISFDGCDDAASTSGCNILVFRTSWELDDSDVGDLANRFNQTATLAHAFVDDDGFLNLSLAVTTRGGLPADNFAAVIAQWQAADAALSAMLGSDRGTAPGVVVATFSVR